MGARSTSSGQEIVPLTAWRGVAALLVFVLHLRGIYGDTWPLDAWTPFFARGYLWVDFFFVLSGFVLAFVYSDSLLRQFSWASYAEFLKRRLRRIYPLHVATLLAVTPLVFAQHFVGGTKDTAQSLAWTFLSNLSLTHAWGLFDRLSWNRPSWSISAEWAAYLLFPVVAWVVVRAKPTAAFIAVCLALAGLFMLVLQMPERSLSLTFDFGVVRCLVGFALGVGVYRIYKFLKQGRPNSVIGSDLSCGLAIAAVVAGIHGLEYEVALLPLFGWLTLAFALNAGAASRLLSHPPVHWLGRVSYSIYLVHWPIVTAIAIACAKLTPGNHAVSVGAMLFAIVATLVIAHYTYTYIEVPWRRPWSARANRQAIAAKTA